MKPILENGQLGTDLDCQNRNLLNILHFYPVPEGLLPASYFAIGQPPPLPVLDGSVTDDSVSATAGIEQSKLNLNGEIPGTWLTTPGHATINLAARGDMAERVSRKGAANGYAPLGLTGRLNSVNVTPGPQPGTVNTVALLMPSLNFAVAGSPVTASSGTLAVTWKNAPDNSWFGVYGVGSSPILAPGFQTQDIPVEFVPALSGSKFTTGTFETARLPKAVGMGVGHASGMVTDPGETGQVSDYIGRDMKWHRFSGDKAYQPTLAKPNIVLGSWTELDAKVSIHNLAQDAYLFYRVTEGSSFILSDFIQAPVDHVTLTVHNTDYIEAYAAKAGYNNSEIAAYVVLTRSGETT